MNSYFIQYNAAPKTNVNKTQEVNALSKKPFVFSKLSLHSSILELRVVSKAVYDNVQLVCISLEVDA